MILGRKMFWHPSKVSRTEPYKKENTGPRSNEEKLGIANRDCEESKQMQRTGFRNNESMEGTQAEIVSGYKECATFDSQFSCLPKV